MWPPSLPLPVEFPAQLQDARIARAVHQSERAGVDRGGRIVELRVVEEIEELGANLQARSFTQLADAEVLAEADVPVVDAEALLSVAPQVAEGPLGGRGVGGGYETEQVARARVEPLRLYRRGIRALLAGAHVGGIVGDDNREVHRRNEIGDPAHLPSAHQSVQDFVLDVDLFSLSDRQLPDVAEDEIVRNVIGV